MPPPASEYSAPFRAHTVVVLFASAAIFVVCFVWLRRDKMAHAQCVSFLDSSEHEHFSAKRGGEAKRHTPKEQQELITAWQTELEQSSEPARRWDGAELVGFVSDELAEENGFDRVRWQRVVSNSHTGEYSPELSAQIEANFMAHLRGEAKRCEEVHGDDGVCRVCMGTGLVLRQVEDGSGSGGAAAAAGGSQARSGVRLFDFVGAVEKSASSHFCEFHRHQFEADGTRAGDSPATVVGFEDHLAPQKSKGVPEGWHKHRVKRTRSIWRQVVEESSQVPMVTRTDFLVLMVRPSPAAAAAAAALSPPPPPLLLVLGNA